MKSPVGHLFHARDGGLHSDLDVSAVGYIAAQASPESGGQMEVKGTAVQYGVVGHFGYWGAMRLEAGAIMEAPGKHTKYRDVLALYSHNSDAVLGRVGSNTLSLSYNKKDITYALRLNKADSLAQDVWARLQRGDLNSASIGFVPLEGEWVEDEPDNSLDAESETVDVFSISKAELVEVSIVAQGAFFGATSQPAEREITVNLLPAAVTALKPVDVAGAIEAALETASNALSEAQESTPDAGEAVEAVPLPLDAGEVLAASSEGDKVEADGTAELDQSAPSDRLEGSASDVSRDGAQDFGGAAQPDGGGGTASQEGRQEAEAQGLTLKDVVGRMPYHLRKEVV